VIKSNRDHLSDQV